MARQKKDEMLEQYRKFYPDTSVTEMTVLDVDTYPQGKELLEIVTRLGKMTRSMPLYYCVERIGAKCPKPGEEIKQKYRIKVYKSREFLEVCDKLKVGTKIVFQDPERPTRRWLGEIAKEGVHYEGGAACLWLKSEEACIKETDDSFALWWRPVEE